MKAVFNQTLMNDYNDSDLLKYIGFLFEELKSLDERMKNDDTIEKLTADLKEYKAANYGDAKKAYRGHLKAARVIAKARDLKFEVPSMYSKEED